jgi:hypothetical protein
MPYPDSTYEQQWRKARMHPLMQARDPHRAAMIAAAPELLQELKHLLSMWEEAIGWEKDYMDMGNAARAAIAKAEGRE